MANKNMETNDSLEKQLWKSANKLRKNIIEDDIVDCIVNLPGKLFLNTQIPASLWFFNRNKNYRKKEILFIDARNMGTLINRRTLILTESDIKKISETYHNWENPDGQYEDIKGFCKSATIEEVRKLDYVLTPGRYVGLPDDAEDFDFEERFQKLKSEFLEQIEEEKRLNKLILKNLEKIKLNEGQNA